MFIKHSNGKILTVIETEEITEEQKKASRDLAKKTVKTAFETDISQKKSEE